MARFGKTIPLTGGAGRSTMLLTRRNFPAGGFPRALPCTIALIAQLEKLESGGPWLNPRERSASFPGHASKGSGVEARKEGDREEPPGVEPGRCGFESR